MSHEAVEPQPERKGPHTSGAKGAAADEAAEPMPERRARAALLEASRHCPFGPTFFMSQLRAFAGEKCPDPAAELPVVELHLADGEVLDLCHVIGVAPAWVALAVNESDHSAVAPRMRTEFVPFQVITRVTLRSSRPESPHLGFEHSQMPRVLGTPGESRMTPEAAIEAAATHRGNR